MGFINMEREIPGILPGTQGVSCRRGWDLYRVFRGLISLAVGRKQSREWLLLLMSKIPGYDVSSKKKYRMTLKLYVSSTESMIPMDGSINGMLICTFAFLRRDWWSSKEAYIVLIIDWFWNLAVRETSFWTPVHIIGRINWNANKARWKAGRRE